MKDAHLAALTLAAALAVAAPRAANAQGVLVQTEITAGTDKSTVQTQIERTRMRTEIADSTGATQVVIFDGTKQVMYLISTAKKTYTEMTKADLERVAGMLSQLQAQLASLPPAQRAQIEGMMRGRGMGAAPEKTTYKRVGSGRSAQWACDRYEGFRGTEKVSELCSVDPATLGFTAADFEVSRQLGEFIRTLAPQAADQAFVVGRLEEHGFSGVPIRIVSTTAGRTTTTEVTGVSRQAFPASLFVVPAGFERVSFGPAGGRQ